MTAYIHLFLCVCGLLSLINSEFDPVACLRNVCWLDVQAEFDIVCPGTYSAQWRILLSNIVLHTPTKLIVKVDDETVAEVLCFD